MNARRGPDAKIWSFCIQTCCFFAADLWRQDDTIRKLLYSHLRWYVSDYFCAVSKYFSGADFGGKTTASWTSGADSLTAANVAQAFADAQANNTAPPSWGKGMFGKYLLADPRCVESCKVKCAKRLKQHIVPGGGLLGWRRFRFSMRASCILAFIAPPLYPCTC
jgi:hypothetical protein